MAMAKMNVLHLHLTEDQGFRIESKKFPALHEKGSDGNYYTQAEMKRFVEYASDRGVRVVPEFDMPGHTTAWLVGHPELGSSNESYSLERNYGVFHPTFDPTNEKVYEFLDVFIHEMATVFKDTCFHIGGDEVTGKEWGNNPKIQQFMKVNNMKSSHDLQAYFNQRVEKIVRSCGKRMVGWDEVLACKPSASTIIQSWRGNEYIDSATSQGYAVIRSNGYYLDHTHTAGEYYVRKTEKQKTDSTNGFVIGLEAAMWSELVDSVTIDSRVWPNAAAIAELSWNATLPIDTINFYQRLIPFSARCTAAGLHHEVYMHPWISAMKLENEEDEVHLICAYLKPVSGYARHKKIKTNSGYNTSVPLNTMADMVKPCSEEYMKFVVAVANYRRSITPATKEQLTILLNACIQQHEVLQRRLHTDKSLASWIDLSSQLAAAGRIGMHLMKNDVNDKMKVLEEIKALELKVSKNDSFTLPILPVLKSWAESL
jgi:hexosaminidase